MSSTFFSFNLNGSALPSETPSVTPSVTPCFTPSRSVTPTPSRTPNNTAQKEKSAFNMQGGGGKKPPVSPSPTPSASPFYTPSPTPSKSPNVPGNENTVFYFGDSPFISVTPSRTITPTPTKSPVLTPSATTSVSITPTPSISITATPSISPTSSVTPTASISPTPSVTTTPSITPTTSLTPSNTPSSTPSITSSASVTPTSSTSPTPSLTPTSSITPTFSITPSITPSTSLPPSFSITPSITPSASITPSFSITPSITPTPSRSPTTGSDALLALLTNAASITAYNAAPINSWVPIVSSEYYSLSSSLAGIQWYGTNDKGVSSTATGTSFNAALTMAMASGSNVQIAPSGSYLVGFMVRPGIGSTNYISFPMMSYSYLGTYFSVGSASYRTPATVTGTSAYNYYFIRKAPTDSLSALAYAGFAGNAAGSYAYNSLATNTPMPTGYSTTKYNNVSTLATGASATPPWTTYNSNLPVFQILGTTIKNW